MEKCSNVNGGRSRCIELGAAHDSPLVGGRGEASFLSLSLSSLFRFRAHLSPEAGSRLKLASRIAAASSNKALGCLGWLPFITRMQGARLRQQRRRRRRRRRRDQAQALSFTFPGRLFCFPPPPIALPLSLSRLSAHAVGCYCYPAVVVVVAAAAVGSATSVIVVVESVNNRAGIRNVGLVFLWTSSRAATIQERGAIWAGAEIGFGREKGIEFYFTIAGLFSFPDRACRDQESIAIAFECVCDSQHMGWQGDIGFEPEKIYQNKPSDYDDDGGGDFCQALSS